MNKFILILVGLLFFTVLNSALPPKVQRQIDLSMMQKNLNLQEKSPVVVEAKVVKKEEIIPKIDKESRKSYHKKIILSIEVTKIIQNRHNIDVKKDINIRYFVRMANGMVGPKVFSVKIPNQNESYIFYLNADYSLSARNYSIDTLKSDFKNKALRNKKYFKPEISFDTLEYDLPIIRKDFIVIENITSEVKDEIRKFLNTQKGTIKIVGHTDTKGTDDYNFALSISKANKVKRFLVRELGYKKSDIEALGYGESRPKCIKQSQHLWSKPCSEINPRVMITIQP
jgi:predicted RND superfamily exporter protein